MGPADAVSPALPELDNSSGDIVTTGLAEECQSDYSSKIGVSGGDGNISADSSTTCMSCGYACWSKFSISPTVSDNTTAISRCLGTDFDSTRAGTKTISFTTKTTTLTNSKAQENESSGRLNRVVKIRGQKSGFPCFSRMFLVISCRCSFVS